MFGKRKPHETDEPSVIPENGRGDARGSTPRPRSSSRPDASNPDTRAAAPRNQDLARRIPDYVSPSGRRSDPRSLGQTAETEGRKLVVGRDISLSGEIKACEKLIVDGQVEADLKDCKVLQINGTGLYAGAAVVDQAEISGRFEGELTVRGRLVVRATGRISGQLRYNDIEIERGGKVVGALEELPPSSPLKAATAENAAAAQAEPTRA